MLSPLAACKKSSKARFGGSRQPATIARLFQAWDADRSGDVDRDEVRRLLRFVTDGAIDEEMVDRVMANADVDGNGAVDFDEFSNFIVDPSTGLFPKDVAPSRIDSGSSPAMVEALHNWFHVLDMNHNGSLDFEEFAVSRIAVQPNITIDEIDKDFSYLDISGDRRISWQEFLQEHLRLLEAIPRPIEEKVSLVNLRASRLAQALRVDENLWRDHKPLTRQSFRKLLRERHGSLQAAFEHLDEDCSGSLDILELRSVVGDLLGLSEGIPYPLQYLRTLYLSLDAVRGGGITLQDIVDSRSPSAERGPGPKQRQVSPGERCQSSRERRPSNGPRLPGLCTSRDAVFATKPHDALTRLGTMTSVGGGSDPADSVGLTPASRRHAAAPPGPKATSRTPRGGLGKAAPGMPRLARGSPALWPLPHNDSQPQSARRHHFGHASTRGAGHVHDVIGSPGATSCTMLQTRPNSSCSRGQGTCTEAPAVPAAVVRQQALVKASQVRETRRGRSPTTSAALRKRP